MIIIYYLISFGLYILLAYLFFRKKSRKPSKESVRKFGKAFNKYGYTNINARKARTKSLPLWNRFVYWLWFWSGLIVWFATFTITPFLIRYLQKAMFSHANSIAFSVNSFSLFLFGVGCFFTGISVFYFYSSFTNKGIVREADLRYDMGSFQSYPDVMNKFLVKVAILIGLPLMIISFNSYTYFTNVAVVKKSIFAIEAQDYRYSDVDYAEISLKEYSDDFSIKYMLHFSNGKTVTIYDDNSVGLDIIKMDKLFQQKNMVIDRPKLTQENIEKLKDIYTDYQDQDVYLLCDKS